MTTIPAISAFPEPAPNRSQDPDVYIAAFNAWLAAMQAAPAELNAFREAANTLGAEIVAAAAAAVPAADAAVNSVAYVATSTSSVAIGTGSKTFVVQSGKGFQTDWVVYAIDATNPANWLAAAVTSYSGTSLQVNVPAGGAHGSGTPNKWIIYAAALSARGGRQSLYIPAAALTSRPSNGAGAGLSELSTNKVVVRSLDFDASTIEYAQFSLRMPKAWNEGTITAVFHWTHASTTTNFKVSWGLQAVALSNDDAMDAAFGTAQYANDTGGTTNDLYMSPETSAITIAGSPAAEDLIAFQVLRKADDATNDTLAVDARLIGLTIYLTTDAETDD
jgi:hypothetical protein